MKLYQLPGYGFPGLHAESFQTARMAEGFLECGIPSTVVYPWTSNMIPWKEVPETYGLQQPLQRKLIKGAFLTSSNLRFVSNPILRASLSTFAIAAGKDSVFLARHPHLEPLSLLIDLKRRNRMQGRIFVELHEPSHFLPETDQFIEGYVVISEALQEYLLEKGVKREQILLALNAISLKSYEKSHEVEQSTLRSKLGLPTEQRIVCYTGQLGPGRNIETLIEALAYIDNALLVVVGGRQLDDIARLKHFANSRNLSERILFTGQQSTPKTVEYQLASDVLVIPYNSVLAHSKWCSPLKLWEYLASGKLIVAFQIPPLCKSLLDAEVVWAREETAPALADAIKEAFTRKPRTFTEVRERLGKLTWANRAERVARFMGL